MDYRDNIRFIDLFSAVGEAIFRLILSMVYDLCGLGSFRYSRETHPQGSNTHGCLALHFAETGKEKRAKSLKPARQILYL
jgi:hypothetical protein